MASLLSDACKRATQNTPIAGRIRPGTKVPTKASQSNPKVMSEYQEVLRGVKSFKDAEKALETSGIRYPFIPKNPRDFRLSAVDIEGGQIVVDRFMELYGSDEVINGNVERKLLRFPVIFPDVPGGVEGFFKSEFSVPVGQLRYHSVYSDEGVRNCIYLKPVDASEQKQAKRKKWMRREPTIRGECRPDICPEFASGACRFRGELQFYVPGISGVAPFSMPTGSQYAAEDIFLRLEEIYQQCRGQIPRFDPQGNPVFFITKALKQRTYFDENGVEKRGVQWVPVLETSIDMTKVYLLTEQRRMQLAAPSAAPQQTNVPAAWLPAATPPGEFEGPVPVRLEPQAPVVLNPVATDAGRPVVTDATIKDVKKESSIEDSVAWIESLAEKLGIEDELVAYIEHKWGDDWFEKSAITIVDDFKIMLENLGDEFPAYIQLLLSIYKAKVAPELAVRYLRTVVGSFKAPKSCNKASKHLAELLSQGHAIAVAHMAQELEKRLGMTAER